MAKPRLKPISMSITMIGIGMIIMPIARSSIKATMKSGWAGARTTKPRKVLAMIDPYCFRMRAVLARNDT
ncbi:hypothetical protein ABIF64_002958 [Bradyrhizobium japonicum]